MEVGKFLKEWATPIFIAAQFIMNVLVLKLTGKFATRVELKAQAERIDGHDSKIGKVEDRVLVVETEMENMPNSKDLCDLTSALTGIQRDIVNSAQTDEKFSRAINRIENYLLQKGES